MPDTIQGVIEEGDVTKGQRTDERVVELLSDFSAQLGFKDGLSGDARVKCLEFIVDVSYRSLGTQENSKTLYAPTFGTSSAQAYLSSSFLARSP
jgi:hypothetical protein